MFRYIGDKFVNERGSHVTVQNKDNVIVQKNFDSTYSRWNVRYVKDEQRYVTGEFHPEYGFYCNREFYIVSKKYTKYIGGGNEFGR
jgi:predicted RNA binding protein YcfA (HicA-like mRNA interferase family)